MKPERDQKAEKQERYQITGWILFIVCALFFAAAGLKNRDMVTFAGSMFFLIACIVFLIPLIAR
ncbi:MAG: hypothetical protein KGY42_02010 [Desulfobacterales bacterium]|nr:hypothetical protein [Desulfobacterales bacterium]MBS3755713.1 hypothetical protein [Desulfobacterales bacterium]